MEPYARSLIPRGSYPTPFLGRLLFKITDPNHKTRYPKKGVGYEPLGRALGGPLLRRANSSGPHISPETGLPGLPARATEVRVVGILHVAPLLFGIGA